eukprot:ANDGO_04427.mRNA.1 hypothetical protein
MWKTVRKLQAYEALCFTMNVCATVRFSCGSRLSLRDLESAWMRASRFHPYVRSRVESRDGALWFELFESESCGLPFHIRWEELPSDLFHDWQPRLKTEVNTSYESSTQTSVRVRVCAFYDTVLEAERLPSTIAAPFQYEMIVYMNHAGMDGPGLFAVLQTVMQELQHPGLSAQSTEKRVDGLVDIVGLRPSDTSSLSHPFQFPPVSECVDPISPGEFGVFSPTDNAKSLPPPHTSAVWTWLSESQTSKLLQMAKEHRCTIQGVVSVAAMAAVLWMHEEASRLDPRLQLEDRNRIRDHPVCFVSQVPCNMRSFVDPPVSPGVCVCASAGLVWPQTLCKDTRLWDASAEASSSIKTVALSKCGFVFWENIETSRWHMMQPYAVMTSSIGAYSLLSPPPQDDQEECLRVLEDEDSIDSAESSASGPRSLRIADVFLLGGLEAVPEKAAGTMVHVYTVNKQLRITCAYTTGGVPDAAGGAFSRKLVSAILQMMECGSTTFEDVMQ